MTKLLIYRAGINLSGNVRILQMAVQRFFSKYGSLAVSVLSLAVAVGSLAFTVNAQKVDRDYKELSIRPRLQWSTNGVDLSVNLDNVGLGPAMIKSFGMRVDGKCTALARGNRELEGRMRATLEDTLVASLGPEVAQSKLIRSKYLQTRTYIPGFQETIIANKNIKLLNVEEVILMEIARVTIGLGPQGLREMYDRFFQAMRRLGISVKYCSLTEGFCESNAMGDNACLSVL
jgi:hypothetical protein